MALSPAQAAALANRLQTDAQQFAIALQADPGLFFSRVIILPTNYFSSSTYPTQIAYVTADKKDGILIEIEPGAGGELDQTSNPPRLTGIDVIGVKLFTGTNLSENLLSSLTPDYTATLPVFFENITLALDGGFGSVTGNLAALENLVDTLTNYFNGLVGGPPDYAKTVAELRALLGTQAPIGFNSENRAAGTAFRDVLESRSGGLKEVLTGFREADAFYLKELDFITNKKNKQKLVTKGVVTTFDDYNALEGDHVFISGSELRKMAPGFTEIKFVTAFSKKQVNKYAKTDNNFIYYTGSGDLYFNANLRKDGFGTGGAIARFDTVVGLRPILSSADFTVV